MSPSNHSIPNLSYSAGLSVKVFIKKKGRWIKKKLVPCPMIAALESISEFPISCKARSRIRRTFDKGEGS